MNRACMASGVCHCPDCDAPGDELCTDCGEAPARHDGLCDACCAGELQVALENLADAARERRAFPSLCS